MSGLPISLAASDALLKTAKIMLDKNKSERRIYHDDIEGTVRTDFEYAVMGSLYGIVFEGDVITKKGSTVVRYLVRTEDFEGEKEAVWKRFRRKKKKNA